MHPSKLVFRIGVVTMNTLKRNFVILVLLLNSILLMSCNLQSTKDPNVVVVGINAIPSTLDPRFALDSEGMKIGGLIFQSLVKIGPNMDIIGDIAKSWDLKVVSNQKYELKFNLKENLKFSDGKNLTCSDILFSIAEYKAPDSPFKSAFENIKDTHCANHELILTLDSYSEKILNSDLPVIKILPKKVVEQFKSDFKTHLIGSGPFAVAKIKETEIELQANTHYQPEVKLKNVKFKVIKDDFTRFLKMYKGDLDLAVSSLPKNKIKSLEKLDRLNIIKKPGLTMTYLLLNLKHKELNKLKNRELMFNGIDRNEIIKYKLEGLAQPATSILTPTNPYFWPEFLNYIKPSVDSKTLREQTLSSELSKIVLNLKTSNTREAVENAKLLAAQLRKLGFRINHESYEWGTYYKDIKQGEYDLATMTWVGAYDPDIYRIAFSSKELPPDGRNRGYYSNKAFDELAEKGVSIIDPSQRKELYFKVQKMIFDDLAIIPLWYEDSITVIDKRIKNYQPSLNGDYSGLIKANL